MAVEKVTLGKAIDSTPIESGNAGKPNTLNTTFLFNTQTNFVPSPALSSSLKSTGLFDTKPDLFGEQTLKTPSYKTNIFGTGVINSSDLQISTKKLQQPVSDSFAKETSPNVPAKQNALVAAFNNFIIKKLQPKEPPIDKKFISAFPTKEKLELAFATNPKIQKMLNEVGVYDTKIAMNNLTDIKESHIIATANYVRQMAEKLGCNEEETNDMVMAAMLHDVGKAFIPRDILAKPGRFTPDERAVVNTHAQIGGEVLKSLGYSSKIVEMVKNHHNDKATDTGSMILRACDMASALREKRYYKEPLPIDKTTKILSESNVDSDMLLAINKVMVEEEKTQQAA